MVYTESEKKKMDQIREVFKEHIQQSPNCELLWSDKVGYCFVFLINHNVFMCCGYVLFIGSSFRIINIDNTSNSVCGAKNFIAYLEHIIYFVVIDADKDNTVICKKIP